MAEHRSDRMATGRCNASPDVPLSRTARSSPFTGRKLSYEDYEVAWIAALPLEMVSAAAMLDEIHPALPIIPGDSNAYTLGSLSSGLNVAIACLPTGRYGTNNTAIVSRNLQRSFPRIRVALMVGIGAGVPDKVQNLQLGDVVVGEKVVQHNFGKTLSDEHSNWTGAVTGPPQHLIATVAKLHANHEIQGSNGLSTLIDEMKARNPHLVGYDHPGRNRDILFRPNYQHEETRSDCNSCDHSKAVIRPARQNNDPVIHYGVIASCDQLVWDSALRSELAHEFDAICIDMEGAGVMDRLPCLVIRGICDYADSHKNDQWQRYAAASAAAYAKSYLSVFASAILKESLLRELAFSEIDRRFLDIKPAHYGTCSWVRDHDLYRAWQDPDRLSYHHGFLSISGKPGAGKSTLMKSMFEETQRCATASDTVLAFFFHAQGSWLQKSAEGLYRSLLYQILNKFPSLERELSQHLQHTQAGGISLSLERFRSLLTEVILQVGFSSRIFFFIDALDECNEDGIRNIISDFEDRGRRAAGYGIQLYTCFASRHHPHIDLGRELRLTMEYQHGHSQDLAMYVECMLRTDTGKASDEIKTQVIKKADGAFLWVVLVVTILNKEFQRGGIFAAQQRISEIPSQLHELFYDMLERDSENMAEFRLCIQWLLFAKRPLRYHEYYFAMIAGLEGDIKSLQSIDANVVNDDQMRRFVSSSSKGLAEIAGDFEGTVQFIHQSVSDYLMVGNGIRRLWPWLSDGLTALSHDQLKECCFEYLKAAAPRLEDGMRIIHESSREDREDLIDELKARFPFLLYVFRYMLLHADDANAGVPQTTFLGALDSQWFNFMDYISRIFNWESHMLFPDAGTNSPTLSYRLAFWNAASLMASLPVEHLKLAVQGGPLGYPISIAVYCGCQGALRIILEREGAFDASATQQQQSLTCPRCGRTHHPFCQLPSYNLLDASGKTALITAVERGQMAIIDILLTVEDLDINANDSKGDSALMTAMKLDRGDIMAKILRSPRIDVNTRHGNEAFTPLIEAVRVSSVKMTELLLSASRIDINAKTRMGKSALSIACERGAEEIVILLLRTGSLVVNTMDARGKTPLLAATISNNTVIVKTLLEYPGIDCHIQDNEGHTAYSWGTKYAHNSIRSLFHSFGQGLVKS